MNELLGLQVAVVEPVLDLLEVQEEVIGADSLWPNQAFLGVGPEAFDAVDGGRSADVLPLGVA